MVYFCGFGKHKSLLWVALSYERDLHEMMIPRNTLEIHICALSPFTLYQGLGLAKTVELKNRRFGYNRQQKPAVSVFRCYYFWLFSARIPKFLAIFGQNIGEFFGYFPPKFQIYWPFFTRIPKFLAIFRQNSEIFGYFEITENGGHFRRFRFDYFWRLTASLAVRLKPPCQLYTAHKDM